MSLSNLRDVLKRKLIEKNMRISELEKRASLSPGAVRRILNGKIPNPTLETIFSISNVLGCSIDELIGKITIDPFNTQDLKIQEDIVLHNELITSILKDTSHYIQKHDIKTDLKTFMHFILETYKFCLFKKLGVFDQAFFDWYFSQTFGSTQIEDLSHLEFIKKVS